MIRQRIIAACVLQPSIVALLKYVTRDFLLIFINDAQMVTNVISSGVRPKVSPNPTPEIQFQENER